ncbi:MAG: tetraacyldisaccharide 4'-kinase [Planctomycetota bacterium]|jgi:tetraacyldisaccharide 4'-kinase|nr:tetraacyldisaccharide 4'-kinase [Planctomycetota bacterium]
MHEPPRWASILLRPASFCFEAVVHLRRRRFDAGRGVVHLGMPVISVGNLTAGGTGKTPMCRWIAGRIQDAGRRPAIALRGYRAAATGFSDEAAEYEERLEGVPIAIGADRVASVAQIEPPPELLVLDDGFQHRRVHRDLDVVLIDASRSGLDRPMLPAGPRREPCSALRRADVVIVTRSTGVDRALSDLIEHHHGRPPLAWTRHRWTSVLEYRDGKKAELAIEQLRGRRLATLFGVGNPASIRDAVEAAGSEIVHDEPARDHAAYDAASVSRLVVAARAAGADAVITTFKDWVKLRLHSRSLDGLPVLVPMVEIEFLEGEKDFRERIDEVLEASPSVPG